MGHAQIGTFRVSGTRLRTLLAAVVVTTGIAVLASPAGATSTAFPVFGSAQMTGLYCASVGECLGVGITGGYSSFVATLDNGAVSGEQAVTPMDKISGLICPTQAACFAVGQAAYPYSGGTILTLTYGVAQPVQFTTGVTANTTLTSIACDPGTTNCVAVGSEPVSASTYPYSEGVVVDLADGVPTGPAQALPAFASLQGIACPVAGTCYAVGRYQVNASSPNIAGVVTVTGGVAGAVQTNSSLLELSTISCESTTQCWSAGSGDAVPLTGGTLGTPIALSGIGQIGASTCPSSTRCYIEGTGSTGEVAPIASDVPGATFAIPSMSNLGALSCPNPLQCNAAGSIPNPATFSHVGAIVVDAFPTGPPTISTVSVTGTAAKPTVTVHGSNFGDAPPSPSPTSRLNCVPNDASYDYPVGVLSFADTTSGWTAGAPGSCLGLKVTSWTNTAVTFTFGAGYVYPLLALGDAFSVSVAGTTATGTSTLANAPAPVVKSVTFAGSGPTEQITVSGSNLGPGQPIPNPTTPLTCVGGDTSYTFGSTALYLLDHSQGWGAGQTGDCLGFTVVTWSKSKVVLALGAFYTDVPPITAGDSFTLGILGVTFSGLVGAPPPPTLSSVTFTGTGAAIKITVTGKGFGVTPPSPNPSTPLTCVAGDTSFDFNPGVLQFTDVTHELDRRRDGRLHRLGGEELDESQGRPRPRCGLSELPADHGRRLVPAPGARCLVHRHREFRLGGQR